MQYLSIILLALGSVPIACAQSLTAALSGYPETQRFSELLSAYSGLATDLLSGSPEGVTILVPNNNAFDTYSRTHDGNSISSVGLDSLAIIFKYHAMVGNLTRSDFSVSGGLAVPTLLKDPEYNNRSAGAALTSRYGNDADGQVLFVSSANIGHVKFRVRQADNEVHLRAGLGTVVNMTAIDGKWDGGRFQIIDSILEPPKPCSVTIRNIPTLASLDNALNRTNLWAALDHSKNVTCLAPNTAAFNAAGNPDSKLPTQDLENALLFHTLPMPLYSNFLQDGAKFNSLANQTVIVTIKGNDIYFNDAKVIAQNVLTNNGLIHVLDKVMSPVNDTNGSPTKPSSTAKPSSSASSSTSNIYGRSEKTQFSAFITVILAILFA